MPNTHLTFPLNNLLSSANALVSDFFTPSLRLGVTGLARSGKTVFITALIRNLVSGGRLPFFTPVSEGRILSAHLEPQPDDDLPRFDYESHCRALETDPPQWPESTRRISQVRISITYEPGQRLRRMLGATRRVNLDIVDYPGEWLLDLGMLNQSYAEWSEHALSLAREPSRAAAASQWLSYLANINPRAAEDEAIALEGASLFTSYLDTTRASEPLTTTGPGRFLMPGDLAGSPLLTFMPIDIDTTRPVERGTFAAMMERRYDSYVKHVVRPFFRDHFSRLDRQVVLVDALGAVNGGAQTVGELERALEAVLQAFRPGLPTWLTTLTGARRISRLLFAATKADHIHHTSHDRLEAILRLLTEKAGARTTSTGAEVRVMALASLRSTRESEARDGKTIYPVIVGVPLPGETVAGATFDGRREAAVFPGDLPADPRQVLDRNLPRRATFPRFRPPRLITATSRGELPPAPHIRLDRALDFLIGDWLE